MAGRAQLALAALSVAALAGVFWMGARALDAPPMQGPAASAASAGPAPARSTAAPPDAAAGRPAVEAARRSAGVDDAPPPGAGSGAAAGAGGGAPPAPTPADLASDDGAAGQRARVLDAVEAWAAGAALPNDIADAVLALYDELMTEGASIQRRVEAGELSPEAAEAARMELRQEGRVELEDLLAPSELVELRRAIAAAGGGRL